jgi:hypothetical protein
MVGKSSWDITRVSRPSRFPSVSAVIGYRLCGTGSEQDRISAETVVAGIPRAY